LVGHFPEFAARGLDLSDFGGGTLALHSGPTGLEPGRLRSALDALVARLAEEPSLSDESLSYELDALLSWFGGLQACDELTPDAQEALVSQLDTVETGFACPHGHPTLARLPKDEVERWFRKRG
jgi:DNA mismatch repair protein MutL